MSGESADRPDKFGPFAVVRSAGTLAPSSRLHHSDEPSPVPGLRGTSLDDTRGEPLHRLLADALCFVDGRSRRPSRGTLRQLSHVQPVQALPVQSLRVPVRQSYWITKSPIGAAPCGCVPLLRCPPRRSLFARGGDIHV